MNLFTSSFSTMHSTQTYEVKTARTGHRIPVVGDVHLHSMYNPIKEAEIAMTRYDQLLKANNTILMLGVGFGYHVNVITRKLREIHGDKYHVAVIDPNFTVVRDVLEFSLLEDPNVKIYCQAEVQELFAQKDLIQFLIKRPGVVSHTTSVNLYEKFFTQFLEYKAPEEVETFERHIDAPELIEYLQTFDQSFSLEECFNAANKSNVILKDMDLFFLAFEQITKTRTLIPGQNQDFLQREE